MQIKERVALKMSDHFVRLIPEDIHISLDENSINLIEGLRWNENIPKFIFSEQVHFADAGQNFESVKCPSCKTDLIEWWGNAMSSAYSNEHGFVNLEITTPCCSMNMSLHDLEYNFPQGFYKTMIEVMHESENKAVYGDIVDSLLNITGVKWRIIYAHY